MLANLGRWEAARRAFTAALLQDPEAKMLLLSPKVKKELERVRVRVRKELADTRAREAKARAMAPVETPPVAAAPVPPNDRPEQPSAPDLQPASSAPPPAALVPSAGEVQARRGGSPVPWVLLGTGVVAGGVGGYFGWSARGQVASAREASLQTDAAGRLESARGSALAANILWGTAGAAATGALISWLLLREDGAASPSQGGTR